MLTLIVLLLIYAISIFWLRHEMILEFKHNWTNLKPGFFEVFITFVPAVNTIWAIMFFFTRRRRFNEATGKINSFFKSCADKFYGNYKK